MNEGRGINFSVLLSLVETLVGLSTKAMCDTLPSPTSVYYICIIMILHTHFTRIGQSSEETVRT